MLSFTDLAVTVGDADAYAAERAREWTGDNATKTAALRRGQDYIAGTYNARWSVEFDDTDAPLPVQFAIFEAAIRELADPGALALDFNPSERVTMRREKVDVIEEQVQYSDRPFSRLLVIPIIDNLLRGLVTGAGANFAVVRG